MDVSTEHSKILGSFLHLAVPSPYTLRGEHASTPRDLRQASLGPRDSSEFESGPELCDLGHIT